MHEGLLILQQGTIDTVEQQTRVMFCNNTAQKIIIQYLCGISDIMASLKKPALVPTKVSSQGVELEENTAEEEVVLTL